MTNQVNTTNSNAGTDPTPSVFAPATETTAAEALALPKEVVEIIGPGKKYKDVPTALASIPHAQEHIQGLEISLKELREDLAKRATTEELLLKLGEAGKVSAPLGTAPPTIEELTALVDSRLDNKTVEQKRVANLQLVESQMTKVFGMKASEVVTKMASEVGMTVGELQVLAEKAPKAFLTMFTETKSTSLPNRSNEINTEGTTSTSNLKDFAHFQKLRKENPTAYYSPSVQQEMHRSAKEHGSKFYGNTN